MGLTGWLVFLAVLATLAYWLFAVRRRWLERQRAADARLASLASAVLVPAQPAVLTPAQQAPPRVMQGSATPPPAAAALAQEKLLFEAAAKAGEAGEPVLSIQLYARLIARYPDSAFGNQARAAVESQKKKLATPKAPGTGGRG